MSTPVIARVDAVLAVAVAAVTVWGCYSESHPSTPALAPGPAIHPAPTWAYLLVVAAAFALVLRRRRPRVALGVALVGVLVFTALGYVSYAALIIPPIALYTVALTASTREAVILGSVTLLALGGVAVTGPSAGVSSGDIALAGLVAVAVLAGIAGANRRRYVDAVRARSELIERTHQERTRRSIDAERLRIARELHDVVAHTMSTINVQAGVAAYVAEDLPPATAAALQAIKIASKDGLRELRAILAVLRQADDPDTNQPQPGMARMDALVAGVIAAGLPTSLVTTGHSPSALPPAVDLATYRIVQESLTNAIRHAGPATATVEINYGDRELCLRITDTGWGPSDTPTADGHGLIGMRERAAAVGGRLDVGRASGGGFAVTARIPLPLESRS
ncbi:MAG TPA: sensor histidine kinase [Pseudonocardiaceae bacterium]|nr:sensor histidine kinase [Pseudonocardiaceae bacterium]